MQLADLLSADYEIEEPYQLRTEAVNWIRQTGKTHRFTFRNISSSINARH
ncbi:hypothetical protein Htur_4722 (plasmid) [Haloterrigena turkmenica DSM 5511]|uniref:Uncharacterized protein n=1 Tax=Haloterrigena turkmenica (strain ATCC 51198 / DSM 5511 / JCM 9101 / NCIMB 13204 / VKM B-1734 / 4k) TaxID=543526 RepID=D2S2A2_HALTV|nr:hypothetical protein Htur_4722 [Haloterrigena turkmenica DSM 5511]